MWNKLKLKMHYKKPKNRDELLLNPNINLWVEQDNPVRLIDLIVEEFAKENDFTWSGKSIKGCTSYSPGCMLKLLLYCYFNWIPGSRRMEKETHRNIEVMWLIGGLKPDHWTICKFRRENKELIRSAAIEFRKFLIANGYIEGKTIVFDGSKMKANAAREMFTEKKLINRIENIEQQLEKYFENSEETDNLEDMLAKESEEKIKLQKKIIKLEKEKEKLEKAREQLKKTGEKYISPTDPDAKLMKSRDGKMACYNAQTGVDVKHHMFALAEITTDECDIQLLKEDVENVKDQLEFVPDEIEADTGYGNVIQIKEIQEKLGTTCYIPLAEQYSKNKDKENGIEFVYNKEDNTYICPNNKKLYLKQKNYKKHNQIYNRYQCKQCDGCPKRDKCTKSKTGRLIMININHEWINKYKEWLKQEENMEKVKQRKTVVEHPYGTIKFMMGKLCFLLRKKHKVQIELDIYSTVYNIKRLINIENMEYLLQKVKNYNWKAA